MSRKPQILIVEDEEAIRSGLIDVLLYHGYTPDSASDGQSGLIMLTAKTSDEDIIQGLQLGADDYVAKPFSVAQLVLRIQAVLRRSRIGVETAHMLRFGNDAQVDTRNLSGTLGTDTVSFTRREVDILQYLSSNNERPVPRDELLNKLWGYAKNLELETRTVDIHIAKIRRKIEPNPSNPRYLLTVRGAGYRLISDDDGVD